MKRFWIDPVFAPEGDGAAAAAAAPAAILSVPAAAAAAAAPAAAAAAAPAPGGDANSWFGKLSAEDKAYAENKGWKSAEDGGAVFTSYKNMEQLYGADKAGRTIMLPKDATDTAAMQAIYDKLGRPASPDAYDIELPVGANPEFANAAKSWFHKAGLSSDQAKAVAESYKALEADGTKRALEAHQTEVEGLTKEWGDKFASNVETGRAALKAANLTNDQVAKIEMAIGPAAAAKAFEFFGRNYTEAGPPGSETRGGTGGFNGMTPAAALSRMDQLRGDTQFQSRYSSNDPKVRGAAIEEMDALAKLAVNAKA